MPVGGVSRGFMCSPPLCALSVGEVCRSFGPVPSSCPCLCLSELTLSQGSLVLDVGLSRICGKESYTDAIDVLHVFLRKGFHS